MNRIEQELEQRILVLDGAMGTELQRLGLLSASECADALVLTNPDAIERIHASYLQAGADLITTCTFNAQAVSLADYGLENEVYRINFEAAQLARRAADRFSTAEKPRFVAGSVGPTSKTASLSVEGASTDFNALAAAYAEQIRGLKEGGVDLLLVETVFDTLNAKAALYAAAEFNLPTVVSMTPADPSGRMLAGQTVEAFCASIAPYRPLALGVNCGTGAHGMRGVVARLAAEAECFVSAHPNAGLPNALGAYDETPAETAAQIEEFFKQGLVNIVGGCCGTTPEVIALISKSAARYAPRPKSEPKHTTVWSGLEPTYVTPERNFVQIGERANVAGSAKFARLVREGQWEAALAVARDQVDAGAQALDVCMDDGLIDGPRAIGEFLRRAAAEPSVCRVPVVVDSSDFLAIEAGLKCLQGKCLVNSISLKEGAEAFLRHAHTVRRYGAAAVVMLFDERGQADTYARKIEVAGRAYRLLVGDGFPPEDIVFDPNVLAVGTGIEEHNRYGVDFIEACRWIKQNLPHAKLSGGVSNLSFAFRGLNAVREALHSVFLYHARAAGLDMGIVNPAMLQIYSEIDPELRTLAEDLVLCRTPHATEALTAWANAHKGIPEEKEAVSAAEWSLDQRIERALVLGRDEGIEADALQALEREGSPLAVVDRLLMPAMARVGELFGRGEMFLPQVVKSARAMKRAVAALEPFIEGEAQQTHAGRVAVATVKGDVHDIGKNIAAVVMNCNGYRVDDLGVMVEAERIVDYAVEHAVDAIGLSGLITPSLEQMAVVCRELERRGVRIPVLIGGATTSPVHTAVRLAPLYGGVVVHASDAAHNAALLSRLVGPDRAAVEAQIRAEQEALRQKFEAERSLSKLRPLAEARDIKYIKNPTSVAASKHVGRIDFGPFSVSEVAEYIDWNYFFPAWGIKGRMPHVLQNTEAQKLYHDAQKALQRIENEDLLQLRAAAGIFPARAEGDDIVLTDGNAEIRLPQLRNQQADAERNLCLADFLAPEGDRLAAFVTTAGLGLKELTQKFKEQGDEYNALLYKLLADRLAEALAEAVHARIRTDYWSFEAEGRRVAFGYPSAPDHSLKGEVLDLLDARRTLGLNLTESHMIDPGESVCGLIFSDPELNYFSVGQIDAGQLADYAARRGRTPQEIAALIPQHCSQ